MRYFILLILLLINVSCSHIEIINKLPYIPQEEGFLRANDQERISFWTNYFKKREKNLFIRYLKNGAPYKETIEDILQSYHLPKELYYVGLIESGYTLGIKSHAGALGPWQFMPPTAKAHGLTINRYLDERKHIIKSTHAAAKYFLDLYNIFGSWELALSGYNAGENRVIHRIRSANTRDFYELSEQNILPKETRNYIPKVIAAIRVAKDLLKNKKYQKKQVYKEVRAIKLLSQMTLKTLSHKTNLSISTLKNLNPDIKKGKIPHNTTIFLPEKTIYSLQNMKSHTLFKITKK